MPRGITGCTKHLTRLNPKVRFKRCLRALARLHEPSSILQRRQPTDAPWSGQCIPSTIRHCLRFGVQTRESVPYRDGILDDRVGQDPCCQRSWRLTLNMSQTARY